MSKQTSTILFLVGLGILLFINGLYMYRAGNRMGGPGIKLLMAIIRGYRAERKFVRSTILTIVGFLFTPICYVTALPLAILWWFMWRWYAIVGGIMLVAGTYLVPSNLNLRRVGVALAITGTYGFLHHLDSERYLERWWWWVLLFPLKITFYVHDILVSTYVRRAMVETRTAVEEASVQAPPSDTALIVRPTSQYSAVQRADHTNHEVNERSKPPQERGRRGNLTIAAQRGTLQVRYLQGAAKKFHADHPEFALEPLTAVEAGDQVQILSAGRAVGVYYPGVGLGQDRTELL